jgi:hypothetical protein
MSSPRTLDARASAAWSRRFARTTPGVVGIIAVLLAAFCVIAGVVAAGQLNSRIDERNHILDGSEPFAYAGQNLYADLSAADAAAATAYLSGIETPRQRARYQQALADAASALADATAGADDADTRKAVAEISAQLAAYTGLVESARANNRQGLTIGSAYLREASWLMQSTLLPGAQRIYTSNLAVVGEDQRAVGATPILGLVLLVLVLVAIALSSVMLTRRTNRQFNLGLVVAAAVVLLVIGWIVVATRLAASSIEDSRVEGTARFEQLAEARILAQQARTDEILQLIARGDPTAGEKSFNGRIHDLTSHLGPGSSAAADAVAKWTASHQKQMAAYLGDYPAAVTQAIGPDPGASAAQFSIVESSLRDELEQTRSTLRDHVSTAGTWLAWSPTGTLVLMVAAAAAVVVGLWPRLKEFL